MSRHTSPESCQDSDGNARNLTLNATMCTLCSDHVDCHSCVQVGTRYLEGALHWGEIKSVIKPAPKY